MYKIILLLIILIFTSCLASNEKEALYKYKKLLESKTWCELDTQNKIVFKNGSCEILSNDTLNEVATYDLIVEKAHGAGGWFLPNRYIFFKTKTKKYKFELHVSSNKQILNFVDYKNKTLLLMTDDCVLSESDSISLKSRPNYKKISIKN